MKRRSNNNIAGGIRENIGFPAMVAPSMAEYLGPTQGRIFHDITEATYEMARKTLTKFTTHVWKSLASTSGGNFETFSVAALNPYLPIDVNSSKIMLGKGIDPSLPISRKNPPDPATQAFMLVGGDYYTVNMIVPSEILEKWPAGKGENFAQADYVRVIPPRPGNSAIYKVKIIELKNGLGHKIMGIEEENQMMRESDTIIGWYNSLGKKVEIERFYCPSVAANAQMYASTHVSAYINFITVGALSKIIGVPLEKMMALSQERLRYTQALTDRIKEIDQRTLKFLESSDKNLVLQQLRELTPATLGLNSNKQQNITSGRNYPARRLKVVEYMIIRYTLLRKLMGKNSEEEKKQIRRKIQDITVLILQTDKPPGAVPVLKNNMRSNLKSTFTRGKAVRVAKIPEHSFEEWVFERSEYLKEKFPNLQAWPLQFNKTERIYPFIPTSQEQVLINRVEGAFRRRTITGNNVNSIVKSIPKRGVLSASFKAYFESKIKSLRNKINSKKNANMNLEIPISGIEFVNNNANNEVSTVSKTLSNKILNIATANKKIPLEAAYQRLLINNINKSTLKNSLLTLNTSRLNGASQQYIRNLSSGLNLNNN
jgi:hypothetical protein